MGEGLWERYEEEGGGGGGEMDLQQEPQASHHATSLASPLPPTPYHIIISHAHLLPSFVVPPPAPPALSRYDRFPVQADMRGRTMKRLLGCVPTLYQHVMTTKGSDNVCYDPEENPSTPCENYNGHRQTVFRWCACGGVW